MLTPVKDPAKNLFFMQIDDSLREDGSLEGHLEVKTSDFMDTAFRSMLMRKSLEGQRKFLETFLLKKRPELIIDRLSWIDPGRRDQPFSFRCDFRIPSALRRGRYLYPFSATNNLGLLDGMVLSRASMVKRRYPLRVGFTFKTVVREMISIEHPYCEILLPVSRDIDNRFVQYGTSFSVIKNGLKIERSLSIKRLEIRPEEYRGLLDVQAGLMGSPVNPIIFQPCK